MYIFVYGTLKKAYKQLNAYTKAFHEGTKWIENTSIPGKLYRLDWYPALKLEGSDPVYGEMYQITSPTLLAKLDKYEHAITEQKYSQQVQQGSLSIDADYIRKEISINNISCWVYVYLKEVDETKRISSGTFIR